MANKQDFIVKHGITVLSTDTSTGTTTGAIITPGGAGIGGSVNIGGDIRVQGVNLLNYDDHVIYVSDGAGSDTTGDGRRVQSAFKTIKHALAQAVSGNVVYIEAGTYTEIFPLTIPQGVTLRGAGLREVTVQPTVGTKQNDAFLLNGESSISDFNVTGFYKPGCAFKFANGAKITSKSPYIQRFSVITRGSTVTSSDPYGFASGDAGNGAYLDAGILDPTSLEPSLLFNEATFIVPNATGLYMTNGARTELINAFFYFADKAIYTEIGPLGYGGVGKTKIRVSNITGIFTPGDTLIYKDSTGTTLASGTIASVAGDYIYINGPSWGFQTFTDAGTSTQSIYSTGVSPATATSILLADYHEFGAEIRSIGSAAVFGNQGVIADGTGTDLKLIAFNVSHIGAGGDLSTDASLVNQAAEIIQVNGGKIYFQTIDQSGDFRVGSTFTINQRTGNVSFGTATVSLASLPSLDITDGISHTYVTPTSVTVGNLTFSGGSITSSAGDITIDPAGTRVLVNSDTTVQGSFTVTNVLNGASSQNATSTTTGAIRTLGGLSTVKDIWVGGNLNVTDPNTTATIANLYVSGTAFIPGGFTATSFTSTELTVVGPAVLNQLTATLSTLTTLNVLNDTTIGGNLSVTGTSNLSVVNGTTGTFNTLTALSTTNAVSTSTGALQVRGGASIGRDLFVGGSAYLTGDLFVDGTQFSVNSNSIITGDKTITLASATTLSALASNSGIQIGASGAWASFLFNGTAAWISKGSIVASSSIYNLGSLTVPWNTLYANTVYDNDNRVVTSVIPANGPGISVTNTQTIGPAASFTINNTGVLSLTAGTDTAVSASTGNVTVWNTANLQSVTGRGATTNQAIRITNATSATSTSTGSLVVSGGVGIGGAIYAGGIISSNGALVWTTATLTDNNQLTNGAGYLTSSTIGLYGVSRVDAGTGISVSANTGNIVVSNIGVVSLQGSTYIALSASSGSGVTVYNLGVTNATAGSGISVSTSTGTVNIASVDTLQLVTGRGATTNQPIAITATNVSASTSTGQALAVSGGIGALRVTASEVFDNGTRVLTNIQPIGGTAISISGVATNGPAYTFTINNQGVTDLAGSTYISVSTSTGSVVIANLGVQTLTAGTDTAVSRSTGTVTVWNTSTLATVTSRGATTPSAITITNTANATSTNTGALQVVGGFGVAGSGFVGGDFTIIGQLNANVVLGSISTAANIAIGTVGAIPYQFAIGRTGFIGIGAAGNLLQSNGTTATYVSTTTLLVGSANSANTATNVNGGFVNATSGRFSSITTVTNVTASASTTTGALQVAGGAGIAGSVYAGQLYDNNNRVVTSVIPTGGDSIGIASLVSAGTATSFTINNLGVTATIGTTYLGVSAATGQVILTNLGVQTISGTTYLGASSSTGTITLTNLGVQTLTAGTDTAVSSSTGTVTVWDISTLQSVTGRGNETSNAISITNATGSSTSTQGALRVSGGVGIGENLNVAGQLKVFGPAVFSNQVIFSGTATYVLSTNTYYTDNILELHTAPAGVNTEWTFDDGKDIGLRFHYWNRGLVTGTNAALVLDNDTQWLEWYSSGAEGLYAFTSATYGAFRTGSIALTNTTASNSTASGALTVAGGVGIGGNLYVGGSAFVGGSQVVTAATLGAFGVSQIIAGQAIAVNPASGTGTVTISNLGVRSITTGSGISINTSTGTVIIQSIDTFQLVTQRGATSSQAIDLTNITQATSTNTGALNVEGGVGIGGNLYVGGGLSVTEASTFTGGISGTITTASNITGGATGSIVFQSAVGRTQFLGIGIVGSILQSDGANPGYVSTQTLQVGFAVRANTATNIASGTAGQVAYQSSVGTTAFSGGLGTGGNILVSNGTSGPTFNNTLTLSSTLAASSTNSGALQVVGGVGIGGSLYVGGNAFINGSQVVTSANLSQFGVAQIVAGQAIAVSPALGTGTVTISNLGVHSITTGSGITISTSTGSVNIASVDTLQLVTQRGNTTDQVISINATNLSSSTSTGQALLIKGGVGALAVYATALYDNGIRVITSVAPVAGSGISVTNISTSNANMSFQVNNTGVLSVAGSTYLAASASTGAITLFNNGVQTLTAGADLSVSSNTGTVTISSTATLQSITNRGNSTTNAIYIANATSATTTTNGALTVAGGIGVLGDIYARNIYTNGQIVGGQTSTSTNLAGGNTGDIVYQSSPGVTSFIGIGTAGTVLFSNGTTATWTASGALLAGVAVTATNISGGLAGWIPIQRANSQTSFISSGTSGQLLQMGTNTATWVSTSSLQVFQATYATTATEVAGGAAGQLLYQTGVGQTEFVTLGIAGEILTSNGSGAPVYQNTLTLAGNTQATSTLTGALQVRGGVGIGGNVWIGGTLFASIDGSISTATNVQGGTAGSILYQTAAGKTSFIGIGPNGSVLFSNGSTASYISTSSLVVGAADSARGSSNLSGGQLGFIPYQTAANATSFISIGSSGALLQSNGTTATFASTLTIMVAYASTATNAVNLVGGSAGALHYQSAAGVTTFLGIGTAGQVLQSTGSVPQWISTGSTLVGAAQNINGGALGFIPFQLSSGVTSFIGTGTNGTLLQMGSAGTATFVLASTVTVGNATRATSSTFAADIVGGIDGQLLYQSGVSTTDYLNTGTQGDVLVSRPGAPVYSNTLTLAGLTQSISTNSGALQVRGGVGIGGNLYVGGILYASIDGSISTATNVSGGVAGDLLYQSAIGVTSKLNIGVAGTVLASNGSTPAYVSTTTLLVGSALTARTVANFLGGAAGSIPIQSAANTTAFIPIGPAGYLFQSQGTTATWISTGTLVAGTALAAYNIAGGAANQVPYQSGATATVFSSNFTFNGTALTVGGAISGAQFIPTVATVAAFGIYGTSATGLGIATASTNRMFFNNSGYIGIGNNTTPTATLDVTGGVKVSGIFTATNTVDATVASGHGAIDVDGGVYVAKSVVIAGNTAASSTFTGALIVSNGGAGINGDIQARKIYSESIDVVANAVIMATAFG